MTGLSGPVGVAVANGYVYWTEATGNTIKRALIASPTVEPLVSGLSTPNHIAVDATGSKMYWTEIGIARLRKADLTGSNVQTLPVTAVHPNGIVATSLPLPVQLVSFTGMFINTTVHLSWRTVSEINNYGFYVERRANGAMEWTGLAGSFVAGHGTTNEPHSYGFVDSSAYGSSRFYRLRQVDLDGTTHFSDPILVGTPSSAREPGVVPVEFALQQNYPNPFNPSTGIQYDIPVETRVVLKLYNILGREVATLVDAAKPAGRYAVGWNAQGMASGIYFYRLEAGTFVQTKRMVLMR